MLRINSATKNLLLTFLFLVQRIGKSAKQMLHFIQHDTTANCERCEGFGFSWRPRGLRARNPTFGCGPAALGSLW
jgi:hypothetical protein